MPATYATVRVMVMLAAAATMGVAGEGEWLLKASPYARIRSTPPSRVLTSPAVYRDALQESPERGMKALSPRIRPRKAYPSEEEVLTQSSEEENAKQLSSSEEEALASLPPRSSSEEAPLPLPLPPDQKQPMESRSSILLQTPPVKETTTTTTPATTKAPRKKIVSITRHYQGDIYSLQVGNDDNDDDNNNDNNNNNNNNNDKQEEEEEEEEEEKKDSRSSSLSHVYSSFPSFLPPGPSLLLPSPSLLPLRLSHRSSQGRKKLIPKATNHPFTQVWVNPPRLSTDAATKHNAPLAPSFPPSFLFSSFFETLTNLKCFVFITLQISLNTTFCLS
ncbi:hypothetical protein E2C01_045892 [Portunus trituberculatus]|uniref:Uncharacterized protein n=1 Tax=Portunus trituberculatus TaxID=210409 RepID=A0A5B7FWZ6_PORTR|nr:hypothetical protein [Portunus trituberculatus]